VPDQRCCYSSFVWKLYVAVNGHDTNVKGICLREVDEAVAAVSRFEKVAAVNRPSSPPVTGPPAAGYLPLQVLAAAFPALTTSTIWTDIVHTQAHFDGCELLFSGLTGLTCFVRFDAHSGQPTAQAHLSVNDQL